jgi:hypothetical protein
MERPSSGIPSLPGCGRNSMCGRYGHLLTCGPQRLGLAEHLDSESRAQRGRLDGEAINYTAAAPLYPVSHGLQKILPLLVGQYLTS